MLRFGVSGVVLVVVFWGLCVGVTPSGSGFWTLTFTLYHIIKKNAIPRRIITNTNFVSEGSTCRSRASLFGWIQTMNQ